MGSCQLHCEAVLLKAQLNAANRISARASVPYRTFINDTYVSWVCAAVRKGEETVLTVILLSKQYI